MSLFQICFEPICLLMMYRTWHRSRGRRHLWAWGWIAVWGAAAILIMIPDVASLSAKTLGVGRGSDLIFYVAVLAGLAASSYFYNKCRHLDIALTNVVRRLAVQNATFGKPAEPTQANGTDNAGHTS